MPIKLNGSGSGSVALNAPANTSGGSDISFTLPTADGTSGQVLQTNGSGALSFASASSDNITEGNTSVEVVDTGSNGEVRFTTEGTRAMTIDSSRRVGIGTSSPGVLLDLDPGTNTRAIRVQSGNSFRIGLQSGDGGASGGLVGAVAWEFNGTNYASIKGYKNAGSASTDLRFYTDNDAERMRIAQGGQTRFSGSVTTLTDNSHNLGDASLRWGTVYAATGTINTSDERLKTEITEATLGADFVKSLRPVSYKWIEGGKRDTGERDEDNSCIYESVPGQRTHWGFIAQEVKQAVDDAGVDFGGWVLTDKDDPDSHQALRYDQFIAPLTKALQEALAKIETLEAANAALEARLTALEGGAS